MIKMSIFNKTDDVLIVDISEVSFKAMGLGIPVPGKKS